MSKASLSGIAAVAAPSPVRDPLGAATGEMFRRHAAKAGRDTANDAEPPAQEELDEMWDNVPV